MQNGIGFRKITADGAVGTSGDAQTVYGYHIQSKSTGAGVIRVYDGTSGSGTEVAEYEGVSDKGKTIDFSVGRSFANGVYIDIDDDVEYVVICSTKNLQ